MIIFSPCKNLLNNKKAKSIGGRNSSSEWPWKQNGTTVVAAMTISKVVNNWRSMLQINTLQKSQNYPKSYPMELFFLQKIVNDWKLLLIALTWHFVLNVTELLDLTLKCINEFRLRQYSNPSAIYMFKVSKKILQQCVKYMKVNSKDTGTMYGASIVNFEHFCILF